MHWNKRNGGYSKLSVRFTDIGDREALLSRTAPELTVRKGGLW